MTTWLPRSAAALERGRLASTFLFVGPAGVGKRAFALKLAQALLCGERPAVLLDPCERCPACVQVAAGTHPDLEVVSKPPDKSFIPVAAFIGDKEHRMHEGLCHKISLKPFLGGRKIAIVDDADDLNQEAANCLLKTLEEPPPRSVLILIGTSADKQLPTIRSRAQLIRFRPLPEEVVVQLLLDQKIVTDPAEARRLAAQSGGSVRRANEMADPDLWTFRANLLSAVARPLDSAGLARATSEFVDEAGKEASRPGPIEANPRFCRRILPDARAAERRARHRRRRVAFACRAGGARRLARGGDGGGFGAVSGSPIASRSQRQPDDFDRKLVGQPRRGLITCERGFERICSPHARLED